MGLVYVVCVFGFFLHIGHCVGFFILSSSGKIGRCSTFFFQNRSECPVVLGLPFSPVDPYFLTSRRDQLV